MAAIQNHRVPGSFMVIRARCIRIVLLAIMLVSAAGTASVHALNGSSRDVAAVFADAVADVVRSGDLHVAAGKGDLVTVKARLAKKLCKLASFSAMVLGLQALLDGGVAVDEQDVDA